MSDKILEAAKRYAKDYVCPLSNGTPTTYEEVGMVKHATQHFMAGVEWRDIQRYSSTQIMLEALKEITTKCSELDYPDCCLISEIAQAAIDAVEGGKNEPANGTEK